MTTIEGMFLGDVWDVFSLSRRRNLGAENVTYTAAQMAAVRVSKAAMQKQHKPDPNLAPQEGLPSCGNKWQTVAPKRERADDAYVDIAKEAAQQEGNTERKQSRTAINGKQVMSGAAPNGSAIDATPCHNHTDETPMGTEAYPKGSQREPTWCQQDTKGKRRRATWKPTRR